MNKDTIYPTMVIRSQAETIELQEKEINRLNNIIESIKEIIDNNIFELKKPSVLNSEENMAVRLVLEDILDKLKELKEDNKMKITVYELLGLIKDGKPPKKIESLGFEYQWNINHYELKNRYGEIKDLFDGFYVESILDKEITIIN